MRARKTEEIRRHGLAALIQGFPTVRSISKPRVYTNLRDAVGETIRTERLSQRLTQVELAKRAGCGRTTLVNIEMGHQSATLEVLIELAEALKVLPGDLLNKACRMLP